MTYLLLLTVLFADPVDAIVLPHDGKNYVCLCPEDAQRLLQLRMDLPVLRQQLEKYEQLTTVEGVEKERLSKAITDLSNQLVIQNQINTQLQAALDKPVPWYKRPVLWVAGGFVLGATGGYFLHKL